MHACMLYYALLCFVLFVLCFNSHMVCTGMLFYTMLEQPVDCCVMGGTLCCIKACWLMLCYATVGHDI